MRYTILRIGLYTPWSTAASQFRAPTGSSVRTVDPGSADVRNLGWVIFEGVYHVSLGPPNDEALAGHPLHGSGLDYYAAHEVRDSDLIATLEQRNASAVR